MIVRRDLTPEQIAVQSSHACLELGKQFPWTGEHPHLVLVTVPDEKALVELSLSLQSRSYSVVDFREPDLGGSLTAVAVSGVTGEARNAFRSLPLFKIPSKEKPMSDNVIEGKYGCWPVTWETYRKVKRLAFLAYESMRRDKHWERWNRKDPHNRLKYRRQVSGEYSIRVPDGPMPEPECSALSAYDKSVIDSDYRKARYPVPREEVKKLAMTEAEIDRKLAYLEGWYAKSPPRKELKVEAVAAVA